MTDDDETFGARNAASGSHRHSSQVELAMEHECDERSFKLLNLRCRICGHKDVRLVLDFLPNRYIRWRVSCACGRFEQHTLNRAESLAYTAMTFDQNLGMMDFVAGHFPE